MKIAIVTFEYPPYILGGAGVYIYNVAKELAKLGNDVTIFTPFIIQDNYLDTDNNIRIHRIPLNNKIPFKALQFWIKLPGYFSKINSIKKFDIIHFNGISYWFLKRRLANVPHVGTVHHLSKDAQQYNKSSFLQKLIDISGENNFLLGWIEKRYITNMDKIIAVSDFTKKQVLSTYHIPDDKVTVIFNGVEADNNDAIEYDSYKVIADINPEGKPLILFVGRVNDPRKGLDFLIRAFKNVTCSNDAILVVVGSGDQTIAKNTIKELNIEHNVIFLGFVDDTTLKKVYSICDVYVCPSRLEGFGLTILEAMIAGKPIIATKVGALPEIVKEGENGFLVDYGDIDALANVINLLLEEKSKIEEMGRLNKKYVKENFSWKKNVKEMEKLYNSVNS